MRERMLAGELYQAEDAELIGLRKEAARRCHALNTGEPDPDVLRRHLEGLLGAVGAGTFVLPPFRCDYGSNISIGVRSFVNFGGAFLDTCAITLGDDVLLATNVQLLSATHPLEAATRRAGWEMGAPITIGHGVWLGGGVIVCPGVTIGARTVVGAGTVVTKDLPPDVLAVGNSAQIVRTLNDT